MFETKKKLRELEEANTMLERDLEWERELNNLERDRNTGLFVENRRLKDQIHETSKLIRSIGEDYEKLKTENKRLKSDLEKRTCFPYGTCCRKKDDRMTLGEFEKEMDKMAERNGLVICKTRQDYYKRIYEFNNPKMAGICRNFPYPGCGWADVEILVDDFAVSISDLAKIEEHIVTQCFSK